MPNLLCDHEDLQLFLDGNITPTEESGWLDHIESCAQCQSRMETLAADGNWWKDAKTFLAADSGIAALSPRTPRSTESGGDTPQSGNEPEETGPEAFTLDFLVPTDEVDSLGRLGTYEVTGVIGRGGSGIVLKAFDRSLNRNVAIKVLSPHLATSGAARKRFAREAQAAAAVVHEHVIPIFAVASHQNLPYIVMQYFPGKSLQQRLDRDGSLELKEILRIGLQTARGLAAAHAQGLVHRDVKPANILLADGIERVSLSDFGLARAVDDARLTRTGWLAGTPEYMSPEQARGKAMDARSDLFSLGSVLYTACTGRVPFQSETSYGTLRLVTDEEPTPIRQLNPEIPEWLCSLIQKLMAKNAEDRFGSANEVADLLETCLAHVQQPDSTSLPTALLAKPQPAKSSNSGGKRTIVGTILAFFGFLVAGMFLWQWTSPPDIAGWWTGEDWGNVQLKHLGSGEYEGTYSETVGKGPGQIQLKWSRIENRFNGTWRDGEDRFGELSIRLVKEEIRGALTTNAQSKINPATPRLADLVWLKSENSRREQTGTDQKPGLKLNDISNANPILDKLQGTWKSKNADIWIISGKNLSMSSINSGKPAIATINLENNENPFQMDIIREIYSARCVGEVDSTKLRICIGTIWRPAKEPKPTEGLEFKEFTRIESLPFPNDNQNKKGKKGTNPATPNLTDLVQNGNDQVAQKTKKELHSGTPFLSDLLRAEERQKIIRKQLLEEQSHIKIYSITDLLTGTWIPTFYSNGVIRFREYSPEFPPPIWIFKSDSSNFDESSKQHGTYVINFGTNNKIINSFKILDFNNPCLIEITYSNKNNQYFRIQMEKDNLKICSSKITPPKEAVPTKDCEYWELRRVEVPLVKRNWAISFENEMEKEWEHVKELPPSVDLLFPVQPPPKIHCPTLIVEYGDKGDKQKITGPLVRSYTSQNWQMDPKGNEISKISWSYKGRKVNKNTPDEEQYEIIWSGNEGGSSSGDIKRNVIYVGKTIKVLESNNLNITIEPSKLGAYPTKSVKEDEVLGTMLKRMENITQGTRIWRQKNHYLAEIPSVYKTSNQFLKWLPGGNQHRKQIYDFDKKIESIIDNNYIAYYNIDNFLETNKSNLSYFYGKHFCSISDALCEKTSEIFDNDNKLLIYKIYPFYIEQSAISEIKIWVEEKTKLPAKVEFLYPNGKSTISTFDWITHIPESEFSMAPPEGAKVENLELYQKKMGLLKSPKNSTNPPESPSANSKSNPLEKGSFLSQIQGDWLVNRVIDPKLTEIPIDKVAERFWNIKNKTLTTRGDRIGKVRTLPTQFSILEEGPPVRIEFTLTRSVFLEGTKPKPGFPSPAPLTDPLTPAETEKIVSSLWELKSTPDGDRLMVLSGTDGLKPTELKPTKGFVYLELVRQPPGLQNNTKTNPVPPTPSDQGTPMTLAPARNVNPINREPMMKTGLSQFQGEWIPVKQVDENLKDLPGINQPGERWSIQGEIFTTGGNPYKPARLAIVAVGPPMQLDFLLDVTVPSPLDTPIIKGNRVPSLWSVDESGKLRVVIGKEGKRPEKLEPTPGFKYFELVRREKAIPDPAAGTPSKPTSQTAPLANIPYLERLFRKETSETPSTPKSVIPNEKEEILKHLQGNWVIEKQIILKDKGERIQEKAGDAWTIEGNTLRSWNRPDLHNTLEIKTTGPQIRIDWVSPNQDRQNSAAGGASETLIPSLWERSGEKLKVLLAPGGKLPEKIEPTLDCIYFELARKPKSETTQLGFPTRFQGKWKVTRMVGPDQKDGQLNLGETVTIEPGILRIGDQIKKAELVDTGALLKGNLVVSVVSPTDGTKTEARILSNWEIKGDKLRFVCGKEVPTKVEPSAGTIYYELDRVNGETKKPIDPSPLSEPKPVAIAPENPVQPTAKEAILKRLQGRWVVVKQYGTDGKPFEVASTGNVPLWTISRDNLHYGNLPQFELTRMEIQDASFPCKIQLVNTIRSTSLVGLYAIKEIKYTSLWNIENGKLKILRLDKEMNYQKVEPTIGCNYYELVPFGEESTSPKADPSQSEKPNEKNLPTKREDSFWMPPAESPPDSGPCLFLYQGNRGGRAPLVQPLWRDLSPVSKTAVFGNPDRPFEITWTFKKIVLLNPSPDAECYEFHKRYFPLPGIPTPEPQTKQVTFIGMPIEIFKDDRYTMVLMPNPAETKPKDASADPQLFEAMLDKIGSMPAASMVGKAIPTADHQLPLREVFHVKGQRTRKEQFHREQMLLTQVCDFHTKKSLLLNVPGKFGNQLDYKTLPPPEYRHVEKFENPLNLIEKSLRGTLPEFVTSQPVDGIPCQVFRVQPREEGYELLCGPWMVWIDPKLRLPVLIRGATPTGVLEYSMFQWNPVLDDAIFSQELPKGFAIQETWANPVNQVNRSQSEPIQWKYLKQTVDPKKENPVKSPTPTIPPPKANRDPRNEIPRSENIHLVVYRKKTDGVDRIVRSLPRHHYGFDQPRKTEDVVVPGAQFSVTWKWGNRLPLVPGPDAELLDLEVLKSGDPVSRTIHKQVYLVGHPVTVFQDDTLTLVLEPVNGFIPATKMVTEYPELASMLDNVKKMESVSWANQGVGLFRDADVIFCCQKKGLLRSDEYRDKKWLRSMVLNFPQSKSLSLDSDQKVPRSEGTLDATSLHLQNLFVVFEDMAKDRAVLLDQKTVMGKPCNLYRIQSNSSYQKTYQDRYLWVDTTTQLPFVIRCTAKESLGVFTYRQFLWNLPLGDDHFLLDRTKEKLPEPAEKPKTEVAPAAIKTEVKDPKSTLKTPDKRTNTKP